MSLQHTAFANKFGRSPNQEKYFLHSQNFYQIRLIFTRLSEAVGHILRSVNTHVCSNITADWELNSIKICPEHLPIILITCIEFHCNIILWEEFAQDLAKIAKDDATKHFA